MIDFYFACLGLFYNSHRKIEVLCQVFTRVDQTRYLEIIALTLYFLGWSLMFMFVLVKMENRFFGFLRFPWFLWDSVVFWWITNDFIQASLGEQFSSLLSISNALQVKNIKSQNFLKVVMKAKLQQLWDNKLLLLQFWSKFTSNHNHNKMVTPLGKRSLLDQ